jgi:hypothetical protein
MKAIVIVAALLMSASLGCAAAPAPCQHVAAPVSVEGERPLTVRAEAGTVWVSAYAWGEPRRTWEMPARGVVAELVVRPIEEGHEVTFRQGGLLWRGELGRDRLAKGPLRPVPALGAALGEPAGAVEARVASDAGPRGAR